ncbi:PBECR3 domain-containing polyvalent protein, partial [Helicobacter felis]
PHIPLAKALNDKVSGAALRHHIKSALHKSYSIADFKQHLRALGQRVEFDNATKALIREIEGGLPPDDGGGGKPPNSGSEDLLDPKKPLRKVNPEEITPELLEEVKKRNAKIWVGDLTNAQILAVKMLFDGNALKHIEKRHGLNAPLVKSSGQPAITREDIAHYPEIINNADLMRIEDTKDHQKALVIGKQINGYFIAVEIISEKNNTLKLKTMYKGNGRLETESVFKDGAQMRLSRD